MRVKFVATALLVVCLSAGLASAQEALRVSPSTLSPGEESFLTLYVPGVLETDLVAIAFAGGPFPVTLEPSAYDAQAGLLYVAVPPDYMAQSGRYSVDVYITRANETSHRGPGFFNVEVPPPPPNPPVTIFGPETIIVEASTADGAIVIYSVSSNDGTPVNCSPLSGRWFPLGGTTVECTANNGQTSAQWDFPVFVQDTVAPAIIVPGDIQTDDPHVEYVVTATDAIDPSPTIVCTPASGSTFAAGVTVVHCYAVDSHQNYAFASFNVTVGDAPPVLTVPDDITVEATSSTGAVVTFEATATNLGTVVCTPQSGSTFALGTTVVNCTATNSSGSDSDSFNVTVVDTTAPVIISVTPTPDSLWPPDRKMYPITVNVVAIDTADPTLTSTIIGVTSSQPVNDVGDGNTSPDWELTGGLTVKLRAERSGNIDRVYTITVQTTDESGNSTTATTEVRVSQARRRAR